MVLEEVGGCSDMFAERVEGGGGGDVGDMIGHAPPNVSEERGVEC